MTLRHRRTFSLSLLASIALVAAACGSRVFGEGDDDGNANGSGGSENGGSAGSHGGDDGEPLGVLRLSADLPAAGFNLVYAAEFSATNAGARLEFSLKEGALPLGLELSKAGKITGKPTAVGEFTFTVEATDDTKRTASLDGTIEVTRKPWLVYVGDDEVLGRFELFAVDTSKALLPKTPLSGTLPTNGDVGAEAYRFSADGSRLAFTMDATVDERRDLYVVDFSSGAPGTPVRVNQDGDVGDFGLTPNGKGIAYRLQNGGGAWQLYFVDLSGESPSSPALVDTSNGNARVIWVTNTRVAYGNDQDTNSTRVRVGSNFDDAQILGDADMFGRMVLADRASERLLVTANWHTCAWRSWLYDFKDGGRVSAAPAVDEDNRWPGYDSRLRRVAHGDGSGGAFVFGAMQTSDEPLGVISPSAACGKVLWSPSARRIVLPNTEATPRWTLTTIGDDSLVTRKITGDYAAPAVKQAIFLDEDHFVWASGNTIHWAELDDETAPVAESIQPAFENAIAMASLSGAPDGSWIFFRALGDGGNTPYAIDLRGEVPGLPRRLAPYDGVSPIDDSTRSFEIPSPGPAWSADSSRFAFEQAYSADGKQLLIADMLHETALPTAINDTVCETTCTTVLSFAFQP